MNSKYGKEVRCPICKKTFIPTPMWGWTTGITRFCSYGCMRVWERDPRHKKRVKRNSFARRKRLSLGERERIYEMLEKGFDPHEIAIDMGVTCEAIMYYQRKMEKGTATR